MPEISGSVKAEDDTGVANVNRPACTECQRRKQKCNREWPCNHCLKRKVADRCRFNPADTGAEKALLESKRKRQPNDSSSPEDGAEADPVDQSELTTDEAAGFRELGYMPSHHLYKLTIDEVNNKADVTRSSQTLPQFERALQVLPPRPYTDILVQNFKDNVNFHYYIIYPPAFLDQYRDWWVDRQKRKPLDLCWTSLLLVVCATATQYLDEESRQRIELDLGESVEALSHRYHTAAHELGNAIPSAERNFQYVQYLLLSCFWMKSEARFADCWHSLNAAVREAQELGMHKEVANSSLPEFDREMRRRLWCILDTWDWQISGFLSRPLIIDREDCDIELPSLALEGDEPSPIMHMKLQSKLIAQVSKKYRKATDLMVATPAGTLEYRQLLEAWRATFPSVYDAESPNTSQDANHPWLALHRHYLETISLFMILDPFKSYLTKTPSSDASEAWRQVRGTGVDYCLKLMGALRRYHDHLESINSQSHFVVFCIFDVSTILCSAILHDDERDLPRRDEVYTTIDEAAKMLKQIRAVTKAAKTSCEVLLKLQARLPPKTPPEGQEKKAEAPAERPIARPNLYAQKKSKSKVAQPQPQPTPPESEASRPAVPSITPSSVADVAPVIDPAAVPLAAPLPLMAEPPNMPRFTDGYPTRNGNAFYVPSIPSASPVSSIPSGHSIASLQSLSSVPSVSSNGSYHTAAGFVANRNGGAGMGAGDVMHQPDMTSQFGLDAPELYIQHQHQHQHQQELQPQPQQQPMAPPPGPPQFQDLGFGDITQNDFEDFGAIWDWAGLDLTYTPNGPVPDHLNPGQQ